LFKSISYKHRNYLLIPTFIVMLWVSYNFAISNTIDVFNQNTTLENQLSVGNNGPEKLAKLKQKLANYNEKLENYRFDDQRDKEFILGLASQFCATHRLTLSEFPASIITDEGDNKLETLTITAQGDYVNLLKLLHFLEHDKKVGRISGADFYTKLDHKTRLNKLYLKVFIQNIRIKNTENEDSK